MTSVKGRTAYAGHLRLIGSTSLKVNLVRLVKLHKFHNLSLLIEFTSPSSLNRRTGEAK